MDILRCVSAWERSDVSIELSVAAFGVPGRPKKTFARLENNF
jgi:hypothetical protein